MSAKFLRAWEGVTATATPVASFTSLHCLYNSSSCLLREGAWSLATGRSITGRSIFPNNLFLMDDPLASNDTMDVEPALTGVSMRIPWRPVPGDVGGNPWILTWLLQGYGSTIGCDALPGRRAQLAPGI